VKRTSNGRSTRTFSLRKKSIVLKPGYLFINVRIRDCCTYLKVRTCWFRFPGDKEEFECMETQNGIKRHKRQKLESGWLQPSGPLAEATRNRKDYRVNIPNPTEYHQLRVPNRTSGPDWPEREDGHYNFAIGDNFTPRCERCLDQFMF
jgi:hypothetical protein